MLARFDEDVVPIEPKCVAILLGMNDGSYKAHNQSIFQTYKMEMASIIERISELGAETILITPTMFDVRGYRNALANGLQDSRERSPYYNGVMALYGAWLREQTFENRFGFVDMHGPLNRVTVEQRKTHPNFSLTLDGMHPTPTGHMIMAHAFLRDMNASTSVSAIHITKAREDWQADCSNGKVTGLQANDNIRFTFLADSLPWVVPQDAQKGYQLANAGSTMSLETLRVNDLLPGKYQLRIDSTVIGNYTHRQYAHGIELQGNVNTPQYQQAHRVAQLNVERNENAVHVLRDLWSERKDRQRQEEPESDSFQQWLSTFERKRADLHRKIKDYEDEIYQANQPEARAYEIIKLN